MVRQIKFSLVSLGGSYGGMLSAWFRLKYQCCCRQRSPPLAPLGFAVGATGKPNFFDAVTNDAVDVALSRACEMRSGKY